MISGIKRQPTRGPHRRVVAHRETTDAVLEVLECGHVRWAGRASQAPRARRARPPRRKCVACFRDARRRNLESEARAI